MLDDREEKLVRYLLWSLHSNAKDGHFLYGDDGELQCSGMDGICDFKRASIEFINAHIERRGIRLMAEISAKYRKEGR